MTVIVSPAEYREMAARAGQDVPAEPKRSKFGARRCKEHSPAHHSLKECQRFIELDLMQRAGEIRNLRQQVAFEVAPSIVLDGRRKSAMRYLADFTYERPVADCWVYVVEDVKSPVTRQTAVYRIKKHLMATEHGLQIREI